MSEHGLTGIRRRPDGSIDIDFYASKGLSARCEVANGGLVPIWRHIARTVQTVAHRLAQTDRPRVSLDREGQGRCLDQAPVVLTREAR